jgi:hypothetical protein
MFSSGSWVCKLRVFRVQGVKKEGHGTREKLNTNQSAECHVKRISNETEVRKVAHVTFTKY